VAAVVYALAATATVVNPSAAWPWLFRQPAGAGVGLLALAAFGPAWWYTGSTHGKILPAALAVAGLVALALGYLYIEAAAHGVRGWRLVRRPPWVAFLGLCHSLLVSLIGLRLLLPVFAAAPDRGPALSCWYSPDACHGQALPGALLVMLAAAWSLAAGVLLQIIWDDQPVTAPLSHVSWHRGG
jgi:hypothetical protein